MKRLINKDGSLNLVRIKQSYSAFCDPYHFLVNLSWPKLLVIFVVGFFLSNAFFAVLYAMSAYGIKGLSLYNVLHAFFYSIGTGLLKGPEQTSNYASDYLGMIAAFESVIDLLAFTILTGLVVAKFTRPTSRVMFTENILIAPHNNVPTLMFRVVNVRKNHIVNAKFRVTLARNECNKEGQWMRRFYDLRLICDTAPFLAFSWLVMHPIDQESLLYGMRKKDLEGHEIEIIVTITGIDSTISRRVYAQHSYTPDDFIWNKQFKSALSKASDGTPQMDYSRFHQLVELG